MSVQRLKNKRYLINKNVEYIGRRMSNTFRKSKHFHKQQMHARMSQGLGTETSIRHKRHSFNEGRPMFVFRDNYREYTNGGCDVCTRCLCIPFLHVR